MLNENVDEFQNAGYLLIRDVFSADQIAEWRKKCLTELARHNTRLIVDIAIEHPDLRAALDAPKLAAALQELLGTPYLVLPHSSVDHNRFGHYHTDTTGPEMSGQKFHKAPDFRIIVIGIYLQDNDEHGGGLRLVPGTHLLEDPYVEMTKEKHALRKSVDASPFKRLMKRISGGRLYTWRKKAFESIPGEFDAPTRAGDVLMWDMRTVHRASPNRVGVEALPGGKIALFFTVGRNNDSTKTYIEYMKKSIGERPVFVEPDRDYILM